MGNFALNALELKNFKCFREQRIEFGKLTVLSGLNGMGKSSVVQALLLLRQSLAGNRAQRSLQHSGDLIELGTDADILFELADDNEIVFVLEYDGIWRSEYVYSYAGDEERLTLDLGNRSSGVSTRELSMTDNGWREFPHESPPDKIGSATRSIFSDTGFQYLSAERLGPRKFLPWSEEQVSMRSLGVQGEHVLAFLSERGRDGLQNDDPRIKDHDRSLTVAAQVSAWLQETSPGANLEISELRQIDALSAQYSYSRTGDVGSRSFRAANVGFGISYALPVLTALIGAVEGDMVIVENPEAHLHPRGQTRMGELSARAAKAGVQVIAETHSDHFLDGVRLDALRGIIDREATRIHFFTRDAAESRIISPRIMEDGKMSDWPTGFFDERDGNLLELLGAEL